MEGQDRPGVAAGGLCGGRGRHRRPGVGGAQPAPGPVLAAARHLHRTAGGVDRRVREPGRAGAHGAGPHLCLQRRARPRQCREPGPARARRLRRLQPPAAGAAVAGLALWVVNVAVFALLYWELDGGGPEARADGYIGGFPDFVFPQQQADQQGLAAATWKPAFSTTSTSRSRRPSHSRPPTRCRTHGGRSPR